jgi:hypothetical protein
VKTARLAAEREAKDETQRQNKKSKEAEKQVCLYATRRMQDLCVTLCVLKQRVKLEKGQSVSKMRVLLAQVKGHNRLNRSARVPSRNYSPTKTPQGGTDLPKARSNVLQKLAPKYAC